MTLYTPTVLNTRGAKQVGLLGGRAPPSLTLPTPWWLVAMHAVTAILLLGALNAALLSTSARRCGGNTSPHPTDCLPSPRPLDRENPANHCGAAVDRQTMSSRAEGHPMQTRHAPDEAFHDLPDCPLTPTTSRCGTPMLESRRCGCTRSTNPTSRSRDPHRHNRRRCVEDTGVSAR